MGKNELNLMKYKDGFVYLDGQKVKGVQKLRIESLEPSGAELSIKMLVRTEESGRENNETKNRSIPE